MFRRIAHLGIAVKDLDAAIRIYRDTLGLEMAGIEEVAEQKVKVAMFPVGESRLELLASTSPDGPIARHIEKKGEGIQHVAFVVEDLERTLAEFKARGVPLIDEKPRIGAGGHKIAFVHPKGTGGILVELTQMDHPERG
ncbi:MAG: methylmalonyl-CoA epimerase [Myxococcales bacterium]|nr:methylmalonyl-CoA epimerase [Myxococcales bacterium]